MGTTNKNKLAIRAWVPGGNPSKKGLETNQWRTFLLSRMSNIKIDLDKNYEGPKALKQHEVIEASRSCVNTRMKPQIVYLPQKTEFGSVLVPVAVNCEVYK